MPELAKFLLRRSHYDWQFYYPDQHPLHYLRFMLECCETEADVILDFTDLVRSDFATKEAKIRDISVKNTSRDYAIFSKILVITEGTTDAEFLSRAIKIRYPHLSDYYLLMPYSLGDGTGKNINGSASLTVQRIEAFAQCEITNRIIGLLDNDKASVDAITNKKLNKLPENIKLLNYPDIELAKKYPCIQSNGTIKDEDVNGRAAAIEMYFGRDVLTDNNKLYPVVWTKQQNQGNFGEEKPTIQRKIENKLNTCEQDHTKIKDYDWSEIDAIFETIFSAFTE